MKTQSVKFTILLFGHILMFIKLYPTVTDDALMGMLSKNGIPVTVENYNELKTQIEKWVTLVKINDNHPSGVTSFIVVDDKDHTAMQREVA